MRRTCGMFGTTILPGTAVIAVKKSDISREMVLPVGGSGIDFHRKFMYIHGTDIHADIVFFHKKSYIWCSCSSCAPQFWREKR